MVTATKAGQREQLDTKKRSSTACHFEEGLRERIVGQEEAVQALVDLYFPRGFLASDWTVGFLI